MNKLVLLLKIQLLGFFNFNKIRHGGNTREKRTAILFFIGAIFLILIMEAYLVGLVVGWSYLGLTDSIPSLLLLINVFVCFILTFMKSNGILFGFRDYDLLISLPISSKQLIASRLLFSYLMNVLFSILTFFLPMIIFWSQDNFSMTSLLMTLLAVTVIPIVPMIAATLFGLVATIIASYFRYANLAVVIFSTVAIVLLLLSSLSFENIDIQQLNQIGILVNQNIQRAYPLATWLNIGIVENNWLSFLVFFSVSFTCGALFIILLGKFYLPLQSRLASRRKNRSFQWKAVKKQSILLALYKREWQFYLSTPVYVMNTAFGSIMLIVFSIALLLFPLDKIGTMLDIIDLQSVIQPYLSILPVALSFFLVIGTTTSSSVSMEGKQRWQLTVLPIDIRKIYQAKLLLNLSINLPAILISGICLSLKFELNNWVIPYLFILPLLYSLVASLNGLLMDCLYAKFDWTAPQQVVKQSFANFLSLVINSLFISVGFAVSILFSAFSIISLSFLTILLIGSAVWLYRKIIIKNPFAFD